MMEHFGGHVTNFFPFEIGIPDQPVSSAKVDSDLCQAIIHGKAKSVAFNAQFSSQSCIKYFA